MKEYRVTLTVNVFVFAENEDEANDKLQEMDISFIDPVDYSDLQTDLIDWEVTEVGDGEYEKELDDDIDKAMMRCED